MHKESKSKLNLGKNIESILTRMQWTLIYLDKKIITIEISFSDYLKSILNIIKRIIMNILEVEIQTNINYRTKRLMKSYRLIYVDWQMWANKLTNSSNIEQLFTIMILHIAKWLSLSTICRNFYRIFMYSILYHAI